MPKLFEPKSRDKRTGELRPSKSYYVHIRHADGVRRLVKLSPVLGAARVMLSQLIADIENERANPSGPAARAAKKPLADHLTEWAADLAAGGASPKHVRQMAACRKAFDGCGMLALADISESAVRRFVASLRQAPTGPPCLPRSRRPGTPATSWPTPSG